MIKKEDKFFEESEDMSEVIYPGERELLEDVHSCENQDLLLGDPYCDLKLEHLQQGELNKDLRISLIFQQEEFDTGVSSLDMNGTRVSFYGEIILKESLVDFVKPCHKEEYVAIFDGAFAFLAFDESHLLF